MSEQNIKTVVFKKETKKIVSNIETVDEYALFIQNLTQQQKDKILEFMKTIGVIVCDIHIRKTEK